VTEAARGNWVGAAIEAAPAGGAAATMNDMETSAANAAARRCGTVPTIPPIYQDTALCGRWRWDGPRTDRSHGWAHRKGDVVRLEGGDAPRDTTGTAVEAAC